MKLSRRDLLAAGAASVAAGLPVRGQQQKPAETPSTASAPKRTAHVGNLSIREYLVRESRQMTDEALAPFTTPAAFNRTAAERRRRFMDMMGLADLPPAGKRDPVPVHVTGVVERPAYRIEKLHYESLPNLHVTANMYVPKIAGSAQAQGRRPGVLYLCGHWENQKVFLQAHPKRFAELGFPTLIVETVQLGEVKGYHHGCYREGWFHWYSRGYSPAAIELLNGIRALDLLAARDDVDPERFGVTGISGGSATTWWLAAADERVRACSPVCGTSTLAAHVYDRVVDGHCDCMWWTNTALWDLTDVGALIAPRPLLLASANQDGIFPIDSIHEAHARLARLYGTLGKSANLRFVETPGGHSYHERSRTAIFSWFLKHLMGKDVAPTEVGDLELDQAKLESLETLKVYTGEPPANNRALTIQDEFIKVAAAPDMTTANDLERTRREIVGKLRADTFNHFPKRPPALDVKEEFALDAGSGSRLAFTSEDGWRLHAVRRNPRDVRGPSPIVIVLKSPGEEREASETFAGDLHAPWTTLVVETRGTGDTSWGDDLSWHLRRAMAWTGRSIASLRVWDALRAMEAARALPGVDASQVAIAARGEMTVVALYAALLDGRTTSVLLESPVATQNAASQPNGKGPATEMLNCLRYTDAPHVAGLLYPAHIVLAGDVPDSYGWAEDIYRRLGSADKFQRVKTISEWTHAS
jgi:cephalosporin-C deacetylase-like acetyl esterase